MDQGRPVTKDTHIGPNTSEELAEFLRSHSAGEAFLRLPVREQLSYIDWIDRAVDPHHRARRMRMIVAVLARSAGRNAIRLDGD